MGSRSNVSESYMLLPSAFFTRWWPGVGCGGHSGTLDALVGGHLKAFSHWLLSFLRVQALIKRQLVAGLYSPFPYYFFFFSLLNFHILLLKFSSVFTCYFCIWINISMSAFGRTKQIYSIQNIWWVCKRSHPVSGPWISKSYKDINEGVTIEEVGRLSGNWYKRIKKGNLLLTSTTFGLSPLFSAHDLSLHSPLASLLIPSR